MNYWTATPQIAAAFVKGDASGGTSIPLELTIRTLTAILPD